VCIKTDAGVVDNTANGDASLGTRSQSVDAIAALSVNKVAASPSAGVNSEQLRKQLEDAVSRNDVSAMDAACNKMNDAGLQLTDQAVRDPQNNATVLHMALLQDKWDVSKYLIQSTGDDRLLDDVFTVTGPADAFV
jgi:hypothetical protein